VVVGKQIRGMITMTKSGDSIFSEPFTANLHCSVKAMITLTHGEAAVARR
jgi:hypothetical protein